MAKETEFQFIYEGPAVEDGTIDARTLAPALIGLSNLIDEANRSLNRGGVSAQLRIRQDFEKGSFVVNFDVAAAWASVRHLFAGNDVAAIVNLLSVLGIQGVAGVLQFLKALGGKKPDNEGQALTVKVEGHNNTVMVVTDGGKMEIRRDVYNLYQNPGIREASAQITEPLLKDGVEALKIKADGKETVRFDKKDAENFQQMKRAADDKEMSSQYEAKLSIVSATFKADNKWRFSDGVKQFFAHIKDNDFLQLVLAGRVTFGAGDILQATVRVDQWTDGGELRGEYSILKIHSHTHPPEAKQQSLL